MFEGFADERIAIGEIELRVRHAGAGPAVLLVHGHPRTGLTWNAVAPRLVDAGFRVVVPDMRGHGQSTKAPVLSDHPRAVSRVVLMDGIPITEALARCDEDFARPWYHWFFFAVPEKPERAINADPLAWYTHDPVRMGAENHAEWVEAVADPETVRAMLED